MMPVGHAGRDVLWTLSQGRYVWVEDRDFCYFLYCKATRKVASKVLRSTGPSGTTLIHKFFSVVTYSTVYENVLKLDSKT